MNRTSLPLLVASLSVAASAAHADLVPISGLVNTGATTAPGAQDSNWQVVETGAAAFVRTGVHNTYIPNNADSKWIWRRRADTPR